MLHFSLLARTKALMVLTPFLIGNMLLSASPGADVGQKNTPDLIGLAGAINVKRYPASMQEANTLFEAKCATCHELKDTTRSPGVLPSYWEKTVKDMQVKPDSNMTGSDTEILTKFLIYDSATRRKREVHKELEALPPEQRKAEQAKIDEVLNSVK